ncbi:MAG: nucleoside-diphosphate sugar epimerase/dehydratase [Bacteroidales bacterium]|nr:nucleoside-diphosphate sugar epimerase/dehydratase [Bacteroidales bacterium]
MEKFQERFRRFINNIMGTSMMNRWIVFVIDLFLCVLGFIYAVYVQTRGQYVHLPFMDALNLGVIFMIVNLLTFYNFKSFRGLIRHSSFQEMWRLFISLLVSCGVLYVLTILLDYNIGQRFFFVQRLFFVCFVLMLIERFCIVSLYNYSVSYTNKSRKKTLIFDTCPHSIALAQWINTSEANQHQVQGFVTRNKNAKKTRIQDLPVYYLNGDNVDWFMRKNEITAMIFPDYSSVKKEQAFVSRCIDMGLSVMVSPPFEGFDSNKQVRFQMKPIQFEDLLGRDEIKIDMERIAGQIHNKVVLITGAAGSIGSELVHQIAHYKPKLLVLYDLAETPLHELRLDMEKNFSYVKYVTIIGDVRSENRLDYIFRKYHPQIIYHAAAYKHVPLMEENPCEAILVNVMGTRNLSDLAVKYQVDSFVMISTDKAVNPTNIMGASKRIAEIYVQSLAKESEKSGSQVRFVTTRFGNVLGSNGSVIPHFREQIEKGGPVTVTHPDIIRYFMTIPEACRLVLEAASFGQSGEIYVFDMGSPVKIVDLAKRMIELAGFIPDVEVKIEFIGLRPGEKLYEELLNDKETTKPTDHDKITVASVRQYEFDQVVSSIQQIIDYSTNVEIKETVKAMKKLVPEFKSQNSPFSEFDD